MFPLSQNSCCSKAAAPIIAAIAADAVNDDILVKDGKYKDTILTPWNLTSATGYFYKTTQKQANLLLCSTADTSMPVLN